MNRRLNILLETHESTSCGSWCWREDWHIKGQSAFILLAKFQRLNALPFTPLTQYVTRQDDRVTPLRQADLRDARQFDVRRIMDMLRLPLEDVAAAFVMPSYVSGRLTTPLHGDAN
ncbi:hypothetical protein [Burkholderia ubonensis]|uniref:hypothetical protein n=1 Tax=Burkholderia ubonensis TaxID=101571 RepID=UPI0012FB1DD1|nr:hypothetical protein [Burkholderia ubonensis]